jgi:general L-amino acid transport system permease protein
VALGLNYAHLTALVILPGAGLCDTRHRQQFHRLVHEQTFISIVGATDFLGAMNNAIKDPVWAGPTIMVTGYVFAGVFYFIFCLRTAHYSAHVERVLAKGRK